MRRFVSILFIGLLLIAGQRAMAAPDFARDVRPLLENFCTDCHDAESKKGGLDLERFTSDATAMADRATWKRVFDQIEAGQMPPPKRKKQPAAMDRTTLMAFASELMARPDPALGARDPGKPVLRRLTRLEYNNTVRDLLGLPTDVFMFPERLPFSDKSYFQPAAGTMGDTLQASLREYGARYPVLLPQAGIPSDGRAEHGFNNRGDVMNFSPLVLEQYVALAGQIANHPDLARRSAVAAELMGVEFAPASQVTELKKPASGASPVSPVVGVFAPNAPKLAKAEGSPDWPEQFREQITEAFREGRGGVWDVGAVSANATIAGKGGLLRVPFGDSGAKTLTINPDADLWLVSFATAEETSGSLLLANKIKKEKRYELTFKILSGDEEEGITRLGICVLGRSGQSGAVTLTARATDGTETKLTASIAEGARGTTFFSFAAVPGEHIQSLVVDGSQFSGDHVLVDDLGFITSGRVVPGARPPQPVAITKAEPVRSKAASANTAKAASAPALPPVERLNRFLDRAFRRPANAEERARFLAVFERERAAGKSEADAMRTVLTAVLASPGFLFLSEPVRRDAPAVRALDDYELATRLSYFLWSSMPDAELLAAAGRGELRYPVKLTAQARRMLRDGKARELSESFAVQWLRLDQLYTAKPDRELFKAFYAGPQGKSTAHGAMLLEALLLFETVLIEDRSILEFTGANYTWLNPQLVKLYGLESLEPMKANANPDNAAASGTREVKEAAKSAANIWVRQTLTDGRRGGFLTMAGPLTVTSLPFRTSPVKRGAWLLETVFNRPPVEPKVAFALKDDAKQANHTVSVRERFEQHRNDPNCFSCHVRLDPPGFALEAFNPIGQWRERDGEAPVDASGEWNGRKFTGPAEFKGILVQQPDEFVRGFIEHLLSYALGRRLEHYDMPAVSDIQRAVAEQGYRFSAVVSEIVKSHPFRQTRNIQSTTAP